MLNFEMIMGKHHAYRPKYSFDAKYTRVVENKWLFNHKERIWIWSFFSRHKYAWFVSNQLFHEYDKHDNMRDNDIYKYM